MTAVVTTGEEGRARWVFPAAFSRPPVLSAVPVDPDPADDGRTVTVAVEEVGTWYATVRVWRTRPLRGSGVVEPAAPGVLVHLVAFARPETG
ncbi:hypothetical protein [Streptomyces olivaceus]|uniref:hypothetical protein n=1 Tax=Streptomyces olivaceus TaxID=47716 RepID=UPI00363B0475